MVAFGDTESKKPTLKGRVGEGFSQAFPPHLLFDHHRVCVSEQEFNQLVKFGVRTAAFDPDSGFIPDKFIKKYFSDYDVLELNKYSTFFYR